MTDSHDDTRGYETYQAIEQPVLLPTVPCSSPVALGRRRTSADYTAPANHVAVRTTELNGHFFVLGRRRTRADFSTPANHVAVRTTELNSLSFVLG